MKVVHVASGLVRKAAGVREVILGLAREQRINGDDVSVLGLDHPDWAAEQQEWHGIPVTVASVMGPRQLGYAPRMLSVLLGMNPDIVHLHGLWMHPSRSVLQWHRKTGRPYIVSPHGMLSEVALSYGRLKKRAASMWFQDSVLRRASAIHVTSDDEKTEVENYGLTAPICIAPNGISDVADAGFVQPRGGRTILSLGRIHRKKALDQLVIAWSALEPAFPEWSLQIVGPDEQGEAALLLGLVKKFKLQRVEIRDPVYGSEKHDLMASAGLFALPTRSENFAITVAESLMLGVPVVSSMGAPWSGLETERCGLWVPFGAEPMAAGLRKLMLLSDADRGEMGARGRAWMLRDFSWSNAATNLQLCYARSIRSFQ